MRLIAWNMNHRAKRRPVPSWVSQAIHEEKPDALVLTEFVDGRDHDQFGKDHRRFRADLADMGLSTVTISKRLPRQNQVLVATRMTHAPGDFAPAPEGLHPAVQANMHHVVLEDGSELVGFRVPSFSKSAYRPQKRDAWNWLLEEAHRLSGRHAIIAGDFNTAPTDPEKHCGDCIGRLVSHGWSHARPKSGRSWPADEIRTPREIDHAFASGFVPVSARFSWDFQHRSADAAAGSVGVPDHAMLIVDFASASGHDKKVSVASV